MAIFFVERLRTRPDIAGNNKDHDLVLCRILGFVLDSIRKPPGIPEPGYESLAENFGRILNTVIQAASNWTIPLDNDHSLV